MANADAGGSRPVVDVTSVEDLTRLVARLGDDVATLVDGKLRLLKLDVEEEVRGCAFAVVAGAGAVAVGATLLAAALAFGLAYVLPAVLDPLLVRALAFGGIGALAVVGGVLALRRVGDRVAPRGGMGDRGDD